MTIDTRNSIQKLFDTLGATYGAAWDRSLGITPVEQVQAEWSRRLLGFSVADIRYALDHLPSKPLNIFEFRDLCRSSPKKEVLQLEQPKANPERVAQLTQQVRSTFDSQPEKDPKAWARKLQQRHQSGEKLGGYQIRAYREALGATGQQAGY